MAALPTNGINAKQNKSGRYTPALNRPVRLKKAGFIKNA